MFLLDILKEKYNYKLIEGRHLDYSTMIPNGIRSLYSNGTAIKIDWGLHEAGKPPTLISPRPQICGTYTYKGKENKELFIFTHNGQSMDDFMNKCLSIFSHEDIAKAILNPELNIIFNLDTKQITN